MMYTDTEHWYMHREQQADRRMVRGFPNLGRMLWKAGQALCRSGERLGHDSKEAVERIAA